MEIVKKIPKMLTCDDHDVEQDTAQLQEQREPIEAEKGNLFLRKCTDKALSAGERSNVHIESLHATQAKIFIASKDESSVKLDDGLGLNIEKKCIDVYSKKQEFDTGTFKGENFSCEPTKF